MNDAMKRRFFLGACAARSTAMLTGALAAQAAEKDGPLKIFMLWDMEGASGLLRRDQVWFWEQGASPQAAREGRELLIADINSAVRAALDAGADQIIVCDTHHSGGNIRLEKMLADPRVRYLERSVGLEGGRRRWMPGLDETVDGLMLMAHHAKAGAPGAFLPHTQNGPWADFRINGMSVGEIGIEACYAGHWEIPLVLVQGDEAACREAQEQFPGVVTAAVKRALDHDHCTGPAPEQARRLVAAKVAEAIRKCRAGTLQPFKPKLPMNVALRLSTADVARKTAQKSGARRVDDYTLEAQVAQQCDILKWVTGIGLDMADVDGR
jgi:D-amino peptidase